MVGKPTCFYLTFCLKCHSKQEVTCDFSYNPHGDKNNTKCIVKSKIKGDNSVNDTKIQ